MNSILYVYVIFTQIYVKYNYYINKRYFDNPNVVNFLELMNCKNYVEFDLPHTCSF